MTHALSRIPSHRTEQSKCIIMLHGVWSNEADLFALADNFPEDTLIFSLRWPFDLGGGRYAWFPVDFATGVPVYRTTDVDRGYESITAYIREVTEQYSIDPAQIYLMGFSQGAIMSYYTLYRSPELIGGIIALSGRILSEIDVSSIDQTQYSTKRVFIGHGTEDRVMPVAASELTNKFVWDIGLEPMLRYYPIGHTISRDEIADIVVWL